MKQLIADLYYKRRDLISDGFDESLDYISKIIPLKILKYKTGTKCWTWTVPEKWSVKSASICDSNGKKILDLKDHPLHVTSYSTPINKVIPKRELLKHIHISDSRPKSIPFAYNYYNKDWGFCMKKSDLKKLKTEYYGVLINSVFEKGQLKVGEFVIKGKTDDTIVLMAHLDHPAMANDDLSGVAVLVDVAKELMKKDNKYTYLILLVPETIGSVAYLSHRFWTYDFIKGGIFLEMLGSNTPLALQYSWKPSSEIDHVAIHVMKDCKQGEYGTIISNDEKVFNAPGIEVPMISVSRYPYPEYHTSDDNVSIIKEEKLEESKQTILKIIDVLEKNYTPKRKFTGPIFLSKYGLWVDWKKDLKLNKQIEKIMFLLTNNHSIIEIAEETKLDFYKVYNFLEKLKANGLIE